MKPARLKALIILILAGVLTVLYLPTRQPEPIIEPKGDYIPPRQLARVQDSVKVHIEWAKEDTLPPPQDPVIRPVVIQHDKFEVSWQPGPGGGPVNCYAVYLVSEQFSSMYYAGTTWLTFITAVYPPGLYTTWVRAVGPVEWSGDSERVAFEVRR